MPPRVLVTRSRHQASELADSLHALGAEPVLIPSIETAEPTSFADLDAALANLNSFHWLLFTSTNTVEVFAQRLHRHRATVALPTETTPSPSPVILSEALPPSVILSEAQRAESKDPCISSASAENASKSPPSAKFLTVAEASTAPRRTPRIAAIGPSTARVLQNHGLTPDLIPPQAVAESLTQTLLPHARQPDGTPTRFLLLRAEEAREHLPETLRAAGAEVTVAPAYRTVIPADSIDLLRTLFANIRVPPLRDSLTFAKVGEAPSSSQRNPERIPHASAAFSSQGEVLPPTPDPFLSGPIDAITFTSSSTARNLLALCEAAGVTLPATSLRISIGPVTSQTLRDLGLPPHAESPEATIASLAASVVSALRAAAAS